MHIILLKPCKRVSVIIPILQRESKNSQSELMAEPGFNPMPSEFRGSVPFPASLKNGIFESVDAMC